MSPPPAGSRRRYLRGLAAVVVGGGLAGCSGGGGSPDDPEGTGPQTGTTASDGAATTTGTPIHPGYETTEVTVETPDGEVLGSVTAAVADTGELRYLGLSDTASLPEDRGMLFVYEAVADRTFVMREMDFGIDIVYADGDGVVTTIHHAPAPGPDEDGNEQTYPGRGQYVLEVTLDWTTERGVTEGDVLEFAL